MNDYALRLRAAQASAGILLRRFGVSTARDIRIERIARAFGARVISAPLDGAEGQLARFHERTMIVVPDRITDPVARRQTITHELAHLVLKHPSPPAHALCNGVHARACEEAGVPDYEQEADAFADAALMPDYLVRPRCEVSPVSLEIPRALAQEFEVSLLRASIRFVELTSERCALVISRNDRVHDVFRSATFTRTVRVGGCLKESSVAWDYFANGTLDDQAQPVPAAAWLKTGRAVEIIEHSTVLPDGQGVLTLLWAPDEVGARLGMP